MNSKAATTRIVIVILATVLFSSGGVVVAQEGSSANLVGTYVGNFGDESLVIELRDAGIASMRIGTKASEISWQMSGRTSRGEPLVRIPFSSLQLVYARTRDGLEMRIPVRPLEIAVGADGVPISILKRRDDLSGGVARADEDTPVPTSAPGQLAFGALYQSEPAPDGSYWTYMRFYQDGSAVMASFVEDAEKVIQYPSWPPDVPKGRWRLQDGNLEVSFQLPNNLIVYKGDVKDGVLSLEVSSTLTGFSGREKFHLLPQTVLVEPEPIRGNTLGDRYDLSVEGDSDLPPCPAGTRRETAPQEILGVEVLVVQCSGSTGPFIAITRQRVKVMEGALVDGKKTGRWVFRNQRGFKTMEGRYHEDVADGLWLYWKPDGTFDRQELVRRGDVVKVGQPLVTMEPTDEVAEFKCPEGTSQMLSSTSDVNFKYCVKTTGIKHGPVVGWLPTGQLVFVNNFLDGKEHGILGVWYPSGQIQLRAEYDHGKLHGTEWEWYENGMIKAETVYEHGKEMSYWAYDTFGNKVSRQQIDTMLATLAAGARTSVRIEGDDSGIGYELISDLTPVRELLFGWVAVSVLVKKAPEARRSLDQAGHETDRRTLCDALDDAKKRYGSDVFQPAMDALCRMMFDPNRDPLMPESPVKLGCTMTNAGGEGIREEGKCIEVTPEDCQSLVRRMCR